MAYIVRFQHPLVKRGVNFFLREKEGTIFKTHTVAELLFDGYEDELLSFAKKLNITSLNIPFDKFGWFYGVSVCGVFFCPSNIYKPTFFN